MDTTVSSTVIMASDTTISTIALAVALVALVTTVSQVLGQFLATADGYRRCQSSVMGRWAKLTHRRFRWSEMRFETLYTTPQFGLFPYTPGQSVSKETDAYGTKGMRYQLDGSAWSKEATYCETTRGPHLAGGTENVSWLRFIEALHRNTEYSLKLFGVSFEDVASKKELRDSVSSSSRKDIGRHCPECIWVAGLSDTGLEVAKEIMGLCAARGCATIGVCDGL